MKTQANRDDAWERSIPPQLHFKLHSLMKSVYETWF